VSRHCHPSDMVSIQWRVNDLLEFMVCLMMLPEQSSLRSSESSKMT
jgi:hypothetical protein